MLESWDLQCERNGREHRTAEMGCQQLVVRRGQPFTITLHFSGRSYEEEVDKLAFNVETGECHCVLWRNRVLRGELPLPGGSPHAHVGAALRHPLHLTQSLCVSPPSAPGRGWCCAQLLYQDRQKKEKLGSITRAEGKR